MTQDPCVFKFTPAEGKPPLYLGMYVDDFIYFSESDDVEKAFETKFGNAITTTFEGEVSHFQALTAALSGTVGLGNIAGVAIAISLGGPGATFWMIIAGLLGMSSKFVECTLGGSKG